MKKQLISGLVGLLIGFSSVGCQSTINDEVAGLAKYSNKISKILELESGDSYMIGETKKKGDPVNIIIYGSNGKLKKMMRYSDALHNDGVYDTKTKITIEGDLKKIPLPQKLKKDLKDTKFLI